MKGRTTRRAALSVALALLAAAGCSWRPPEKVIARFDDPKAFASRWTEGLFEPGGDGQRRWIRCVTPGTGVTALVANPLPYDPPIDFRGKFVKVEVKIEDMLALAGMEFRLASGGVVSDFYELTIPLFADEHFNVLQSGEWQTLTFSFGEARVVGSPDLSAIDTVGWMVRDRPGPDGPEPLVAYWSGLSAVEAPPRGIVSLTFDGGYQQDIAVAAPIMAEHGFRGTAYVMPDQVGEYPYMGLAQLFTLRDRYGWHIAAHHALPFTELEPGELDETLRGIRSFLRDNDFDRDGAHLAYPLGKQEPETVVPLARQHFQTSRIASAGPETFPPADLHRLRAVDITATTSVEQIRQAVRRASQHHEWLILTFPRLLDDPEQDTEFGVDDFRRAMELIRAEEIDVRTVAEVWSELRRNPIPRLLRALRVQDAPGERPEEPAPAASPAP